MAWKLLGKLYQEIIWIKNMEITSFVKIMRPFAILALLGPFLILAFAIILFVVESV